MHHDATLAKVVKGLTRNHAAATARAESTARIAGRNNAGLYVLIRPIPLTRSEP
jgi:hypothetical protein